MLKAQIVMSFREPAVLRYLKCARCRNELVLRQMAPAAQTNTGAASSVQELLLCTNADCRLEFSIQDEIPVLVTEFARELPLDQWQTLIKSKTSSSPSSEIAPAAG